MKKPIITLALMAATLLITPLSAQADDTNWYIGGGAYESDPEFNTSDSGFSESKTSGKLIEVGYNGEIFGSNLYSAKIDHPNEIFGEYILGAEIDAGWKFHLGDSFTIKPYALIGVQTYDYNDEFAHSHSEKPTMKAGAGIMGTWKMLYLDVELVSQYADLGYTESDSQTPLELDEDVATVTFGFTF